MRRNYISIGNVSVKVSNRGLAPWGYPVVRIGGYSFWNWSNTGHFMPASYHPRTSITWIWSARIVRTDEARSFVNCRNSSPYTKVRLPFGWVLVIARQQPMWRRK